MKASTYCVATPALPVSAASSAPFRANWMVTHQCIEIGEVDDPSVEIIPPVPVYDAGQEQSRNEKEVGHA